MFAPGDVVLVWDAFVRPPKEKLHICISNEKQLFLRINSAPRYKPHLKLDGSSDFLRHDSYVELTQLVRLRRYDIDNARTLGRVSKRQAAEIVAAAQSAKTLTADHADFIEECLRSV